jgi:spore maturation protein CgeB
VANARLVRLAQRERPDLFLALFGFDISEETIRTFRSLGILTACWWLNDPFQLPRSLRQASWYDWYFTNARGCLEEYWNAGVGAARFLPLAADVDVHRPPHLTREDGAHYASEVCFAGDWSPLREDWVSRLLARHLVRVWGPWGKKLAPDSPVRRVLADGFFTPAEMVRAFAGAKVVLNLHTWFGKWSFGVNPRLFEAAGVGACQFVDRKDEIPDLYRVPEEVVCFESFEECERLLDYYLARDAERGAIGARASLRTHREHTYDARMRMLLGVVGGGMAARPSVE